MHSEIIYEGPTHKWVMFGRDPNRPDQIIDTNQYMIISGDEAIILDPGGVELFAPMLSSVLKYVELEQIKYLFASHQDPDIISSLGFWDKTLENAKLYSPWLWEGFIRHFGMQHIEYVPIPDTGMVIQLGNISLNFSPAHYLHSSGNFNVYDPQAKILMSGDIGAALEEGEVPLFVKDFNSHTPNMKLFHQRWMPSNRAKNEWCKRVRSMDIDMMAPQHGRIFKGEHVDNFVNWFEALEVGSAKNL
ncbi:MAG: flavorubredoxin [Phenylobacterium sp.]|jgi:flavorubredoxin